MCTVRRDFHSYTWEHNTQDLFRTKKKKKKTETEVPANLLEQEAGIIGRNHSSVFWEIVVVVVLGGCPL